MIKNTGGTMQYMILRRTLTMDLVPLSYVVEGFLRVSFSAMEPKIVSSPTATTIASAEPPTTLVPMKAMLLQPRISVPCTGSAYLVTPPDSPVRADWSTLRWLDLIILTSAGTMSPVSRMMMSPTTSSLESISISTPSRRTVMMVVTILTNCAAAFELRVSWMKVTIPLTRISVVRITK